MIFIFHRKFFHSPKFQLDFITKFYRYILWLFICHSRKENVFNGGLFEIIFAQAKPAPLFRTLTQYFCVLPIKLFWTSHFIIIYIIFFRSECTSNSISLSFQNQEPWKSWLEKVTNIVLNKYSNRRNFVLQLLLYLLFKYLIARWPTMEVIMEAKVKGGYLVAFLLSSGSYNGDLWIVRCANRFNVLIYDSYVWFHLHF